MNRLLKFVLVLALLSGYIYNNVRACTSVLVSGKGSRDGRPFILKNRDTPSL